MYQVAFVGENNEFDIRFIEEKEDMLVFAKTLMKKQIISISLDYHNIDLNEVEFADDNNGDYIWDCENNLILKNTAVYFDGIGWMTEEMASHYKKCHYCGEYHHVRAMHKTHDADCNEDVFICNKCVTSRRGYTCDHCGMVVFKSNITYIDGDFLCETCLEEEKAQGEIAECRRCGQMHYVENMQRDIDDNYLCPSCYEYLDDNYIDSYHHDRDFDFCYLGYETTEERKQVIGIELEIGNGPIRDNILAKYCIETMDDKLICKEDGSIREEGFEMVTYPFSYRYYETMKDNIEKVLEKCKHRGFESGTSSNTGMHIHINKPWFGDDTCLRDRNIDRMLFFFEGFWDNICKFSRRRKNKIAEWANRYVSNAGNNIMKKKDVYNLKKEVGRYVAVNLCNSGTVEIRIFNGTLDPVQFFANVEFVKRLMDIITTYTDKQFANLTWNEFIYGDEQYSNLIAKNNCDNGDEKLDNHFIDLYEPSKEIDYSNLMFDHFPDGTEIVLYDGQRKQVSPEKAYRGDSFYLTKDRLCCDVSEVNIIRRCVET